VASYWAQLWATSIFHSISQPVFLRCTLMLSPTSLSVFLAFTFQGHSTLVFCVNFFFSPSEFYISSSEPEQFANKNSVLCSTINYLLTIFLLAPGIFLGAHHLYDSVGFWWWYVTFSISHYLNFVNHPMFKIKIKALCQRKDQSSFWRLLETSTQIDTVGKIFIKPLGISLQFVVPTEVMWLPRGLE
jgi:hypothetical protein